MMEDHHWAKYFLDELTMGEWWDAVDGERLATERRGLSCEVKMNPIHYWADDHLAAATPNYLCCISHGLSEITFAHSLESFGFRVKKSSPIKFEGDWIIVEGHSIRFRDIRPSSEKHSVAPK